MRKCTLRYVWMGTSYKSELTIMNTAAFLPMIRHLNKCSCCVFWNMRSHREERLAVAWGCQPGIKNIGKTKDRLGNWILTSLAAPSRQRVLFPSHCASSSFRWITYTYALGMYVWCPSFPSDYMFWEHRKRAVSAASNHRPVLLQLIINRKIGIMIHTGGILCKYDFRPPENFMSHLEPCKTKVNTPIAPVGPEAGVSLSPA